MAYVNVHVSRLLKEELAWVIDKWLRIIVNTMLFKTIILLKFYKIKPFFNIVCVAM